MSGRHLRAGQLALTFPNTWGGKRAGAGRKRAPGVRPSVPHRPRDPHRNAHPVLVTLRARAGLPPFREQALGTVIREALRAASKSPAVGAFRVIHFSIQRDHLHLIVEARDGSVLARGMQGLGVRVARAINGLLGIGGSVMAERFHSRELRSPREVRNALVYVLMNFKKHARRSDSSTLTPDAFSSAPWFDGFRHAIGPPPPDVERPTAFAHTWLAAKGWRRRGLLVLEERPHSA